MNPPLTILSFENCAINTPRQLVFQLKNTSGIQTSFSIAALKYPPPLADFGGEQEEVGKRVGGGQEEGGKRIGGGQEEGGRKIGGGQNESRRVGGGRDEEGKRVGGGQEEGRSPLKSMKSTLNKFDKSLPLLTSDLEKSQNFFSSAGRALNKAKQLQRDQKLYLTSDSGLCLLPSPSSSLLLPSSTQPITLTLYNDICGEFTDSIQISVKGLPVQTFDVRIRVKGSPLRLAEHQVGISQEGGIGFGEVVRRGGRLGRKFWVENTGPKEIGLEWRVFEVGGGYERRDFFELEVGEEGGGWGVKWKAVEPERREGEESFVIEPR